MTTFDPDSITPSDDFMRGLINKTNYRDACVLSARWGAEQAVEALKHQWPEPLMRPVTKEDGDKNGFVQVWLETDGSCFYNLCRWEDVNGRPWLHTASWQPKPEPTPKVKALNILQNRLNATRPEGCAYFGVNDAGELLSALLALPGEVTQVPCLIDGNIKYTWKE
jgi:hypothetical protein